jgi:hypothetical protein
MPVLHEWQITGKIDSMEAMSTIFHKNLSLYFSKWKLKNISDLRIKLEDTEHGSKIVFYTDK